MMDMQALLDSDAARWMGLAVLHSLWELAGLGALAWAVLAVLRQALPTTRYAVAGGFLLAMALAGPATFYALGREPAAAGPAVMAESGATGGLVTVPGRTAVFSWEKPARRSATEAPRARVSWRMALPYVAAGWLAGVMVFALRLLLGGVHLRRLRRGATAAPALWRARVGDMARRLGLARPVLLLMSGQLEVPSVFGWLRPVVLVPASALTGLPAEQLAALLAHELAHIRRHDYVVNLLQSVVETLLFYHPAVWWLSRRMRAERELCCDDMAAEASDRVTYARALAAMEELRSLPLAPAANGGDLVVRIRRLLEGPERRTVSRGRSIGAAALMLSIPVAAVLYIAACQRGTTPPAPATAASTAPATRGVAMAGVGAGGGSLANGDAEAESAADRAVRERLDGDMTTLEADQQALEKVIGFLQGEAKADVYVNWEALRGAGVDRNTPVSVNLHRVAVGKVLRTVLSEAGGPTNPLGYDIEAGVITISTKEDLNARQPRFIRVYDIRDLLVEPQEGAPPSLDMNVGGATSEPAGAPARVHQGREAIVKEITKTLEDTVAPLTWRDRGGSLGDMRELNGQLIVNQTGPNQQAILMLLNQLRESRLVQITIEARLVLVDDETLGAMNLSELVAKSPATQRAADQRGAILDEAALNRVLRTVEAARSSSTVQAPRVTVFNGERAYAAVASQQCYTAAWRANPDRGTAATRPFVPEVKTLTTGLVLEFTATASADRKYAVVQVKYGVATLLGMETVAASNAPAEAKLMVDLPRVKSAGVDTMASIPDGETLVLGGQRLSGEEEAALGVGAGPAATAGATTMKAGERTLLLLVRPKIIVQREEGVGPGR